MSPGLDTGDPCSRGPRACGLWYGIHEGFRMSCVGSLVLRAYFWMGIFFRSAGMESGRRFVCVSVVWVPEVLTPGVPGGGHLESTICESDLEIWLRFGLGETVIRANLRALVRV